MMTYDDYPDALKFHEQHELAIPILRDVNVQHVNSFGILNDKYEPGHWAYGIPLPGIFLVDKNGTIRAKFAEEDYKDRPDLENVLEAARAMVSVSSVQKQP
ncbi:MAG TPA: redoxin domain-containing protein [Pseudomonadales bacterium]|nr:redoxin domain-containing protein [Pseudomonadales bacterium]